MYDVQNGSLLLNMMMEKGTLVEVEKARQLIAEEAFLDVKTDVSNTVE